MSVKYRADTHKKGRDVLAQFKPGKVHKSRTFNIEGQKYVYLIEIIFDDKEKPVKFMPQDVEKIDKNL